MSQQFHRICERQMVEEVQEHCNELKLASELQVADVNRQLTASYKVNRVRLAFGIVPIISSSLLKTGAKYIPGLLAVGTVAYLSYRDIAIREEVKASADKNRSVDVKHHGSRVPSGGEPNKSANGAAGERNVKAGTVGVLPGS
ncbi:unnamed protein product [Hermetia illucens]|uniref:Uncharacterized protein n=1 Tax=Hermetia illucens TaxID=343691 RepID=A0A7R8UDD9_HERIL|nr:unnamed protein product [Hermetia illucens]